MKVRERIAKANSRAKKLLNKTRRFAVIELSSYLNLYSLIYISVGGERKDKKFDWPAIYDIDVKKIKWGDVKGRKREEEKEVEKEEGVGW